MQKAGLVPVFCMGSGLVCRTQGTFPLVTRSYLAMNFRLLCTTSALLLAASSWMGTAQAQLLSRAVASTPHVRAELMAYAPDGVAPGATVWAGLQLSHQPEWHSYWKNAGDSGLPTTLVWTLPPGVKAGDIAWPLPRKIPVGTLANYGYEGTVLLPVPLTIGPDFRPSPLEAADAIELKLHAAWLVCRTECIPEEAKFSLRLPLHGSTALQAGAFAQAQAAQPELLVSAATIAVVDKTLQFSVSGLPPQAHGKTLELFSETPELLHSAAVLGRDWAQSWDGPLWRASYPLAAYRQHNPATLAFVLALADADRVAEQPAGWRTEAAITGLWPAVEPVAGVSPALQDALARNAAVPTPGMGAPMAASQGVFLAALLAALLGGLLLNLMPCVFPVLALKILAFAKTNAHPRGQRQAGLAYTAGVLLSFLLLGAALLSLRTAGAQIGWGFQLQSPAMVAALAALFTLLGLNLTGMFEFGQFVPSRLASTQVRSPLLNHFLSGVLAVLVASPCTAPFMGASLGLAIGLPTWQALGLFAALGLGLALPYCVASWVPGVARLLPRPGPWMDTLRRLLAFPMFATAAWLVWVLGQQSGIDGAGALLALLVGLSAVVWALGLSGRTRWLLGGVSLALFAALFSRIGPKLLEPPVPMSASDDRSGNVQPRWQAWSAAEEEALTARGQPVFVDFTAAWCISCQLNQQTTLTNAAVLADFEARQVTLLRADWTRRDPAIGAALGVLGRSGVPVYVLHRPGQPPLVLAEILTPGQVHRALATLGPRP